MEQHAAGRWLAYVNTCATTFLLTYGDGVADVNISALLEHHRQSGLLATLTAVQPPGRFGVLELEGNQVQCFHEKPDGDNAWINGGFFVLNPAVIDLISGDNVMWEREPLQLSPLRVSFRSTGTMVFGAPWTRCAIARCGSSSGIVAKHPGRCGDA